MNKKILAFGAAALLLVGLPAAIFLTQTTQNTRSRASGPTTTNIARCNFNPPSGDGFMWMEIVGSQIWVVNSPSYSDIYIHRLNFDGTQAAPPIKKNEIPDLPQSLVNTGSEVWAEIHGGTVLRLKHDGTPAGDPIMVINETEKEITDETGIEDMAMVNSQVWITTFSGPGGYIYKYDTNGTLLSKTDLNPDLLEDIHPRKVTQVGSEVWISYNGGKILRYDLNLKKIGSEISGNGLRDIMDIEVVGNQVWVASWIPDSNIARFNLDGTPVGTPISMIGAVDILTFEDKVWVSDGYGLINQMRVYNLDGTIPQECILTPSPTPQITGTRLDMKIFLHGIGKGGDNVSPNIPNSENINPLHPIRDFNVTIYDTQNRLVASPNSTLTYNVIDGNFIGTIGVKDQLASGTYSIKIKSPGYLNKRISSTQINSGQANTLPAASLVAGDINGDNKLNTLDYSLFQACFQPTGKAFCTSDIRRLGDLNDDGAINVIDLNIFLREAAVREGD